MSKFDLYETITNQIVTMLEAGTIPWRSPIMGRGTAGHQAYWRPSSDEVHIPEPVRFTSGEEYYSTLFHELSHSTGHSTRLDRKLDTEPHMFGTPSYGKEELVAEMAAAFLCGHVGITPRVIDNQAAYLQGWLKTIKADKKLVIAAASAAQKAADWIRNERQGPVT
jgi:antirestriction protein ArdC